MLFGEELRAHLENGRALSVVAVEARLRKTPIALPEYYQAVLFLLFEREERARISQRS
jgi:hypothetical protein